MSWGYWLYQSILKLFQQSDKEDSDSVYDMTSEHKEGSYGDDRKHGEQVPGVHYEVYPDKHLADDGDEIKEFGLDLDNFMVGPEIIRTNKLHYSL